MTTLTGLLVMGVMCNSHGMDLSMITLLETMKVLAVHNSDDGPPGILAVEVTIWLYRTLDVNVESNGTGLFAVSLAARQCLYFLCAQKVFSFC